MRAAFQAIEKSCTLRWIAIAIGNKNREPIAQNWEAVLLTTASTGCCMTAQKILFLAANPQGTTRLRLGQEVRKIREVLRRSQFDLRERSEVRSADVRQAMLDLNPWIVHFSGHGEGREFGGATERSPTLRKMNLDEEADSEVSQAAIGLVFEDEGGKPKRVSGEALAGLFQQFTGCVECVVLNSCYSAAQAEAIARHIPYVIGMTKAIGDQAAIEFAVGFYDALGAGRSIVEAYGIGCSAIQMEGMAEHLTPVLLQKASAGLRQSADPMPPAKLLNVPELPPHFLDRSAALEALKQKVLVPRESPVVMTGTQQVGVQGMGGLGKSVLAAALARDAAVQREFGDGVFWVTVGIEPLLVGLQSQLAVALGDREPTFSEVSQGRARLQELLESKACLLILDDVWQVADAAAFAALGSRCRLVMTTRDAGLITDLGATEHRLEVLDEPQALRLLAEWAGQTEGELPAAALAVARECGYLPLALSVCGAMVREGTLWLDLQEALQEADLGFLEKAFPHYRNWDVLKALSVSVEALARTHPGVAECYRSVDEGIPEVAVLRLWMHDRELKERQGRQMLVTLSNKALLRLEGDAPGRSISLHDLQADYLRAIQPDRVALHERLLAAYGEACAGVWSEGENDGYFFEHLGLHLQGAGRLGELQALLFRFEWLRAKLEATDVNALLGDFDRVLGDAELELVRGAIGLSAHVLAKDKTQLQSQLYGRLLSFETPAIQMLLERSAQCATAPWFRCLTPSLTAPGGALIRTLEGHTFFVTAVVITPDGKQAVSGSSDHTLRVWDISSGTYLRSLEGHTDMVTAVAITPDGKQAVSGSSDHTLRIWDISSGTCLRSLEGHTDVVTAVAVTPDGKQAVSASYDFTLRVWDISKGTCLCSLEGHISSVSAVAITPDGKQAVSASSDRTLKVWDITSGWLITSFRGESSIWTCAIAPDGVTIVAGEESGRIHFLQLEGV